MIASPWAAAALVCLHLGAVGALPPEVRYQDVRPYLAGDRHVRLLIAGEASSLRLTPKSDSAVEDPHDGARLAVVKAGASLTARRASGTIALRGPGLSINRRNLRIVPLQEDSGIALSSIRGWGRSGLYPGAIDINLGPGGIRVVERTDIETYIAGVVASEMPASFPLEAMKAQAIAARTYALYHLGAHSSEGADLCGRVHCQAYAGRPNPNSRAARATAETAGQVLVWNGLLLDAMYSAACGGATATAWDVRQGKLLPYLREQPDSPDGFGGSPYCARDHDITWTKRFSLTEAGRFVSRNLDAVTGTPGLKPGRLESLRLMKDPSSTRAQWLKVYTTNGAYPVRGDAIRWLFGNGRPGPEGLRSIAFEMSVEEDSAGRPSAFVFSGAGRGHGIGLCQWGARGRALAGQTAPEILAAYYPGAALIDLRP